MRPNRGRGMLDLVFGTAEDPKAIRGHLRAAVKADSSNRPAHEAYVEWVESKLDDDRLAKPKRQPLENELAEVMSSWSKALPEDVEPRLWLVDYLLENERLEEAKPHVDFLAASRLDDPRLRDPLEVAAPGGDAAVPQEGVARRRPDPTERSRGVVARMAVETMAALSESRRDIARRPNRGV